MTLERCKVAYQKLNEITQTRIFRGPPNNQFHTLVQLHCMMNDLYIDFQINDIRELYEILISNPLSGFQCLNHAQHGMVVLYNEPLVPGGGGNGLLRSPQQQQQPQQQGSPLSGSSLSPAMLFNNQQQQSLLSHSIQQQQQQQHQHNINNNPSSSSLNTNALFGSMS